MFKLGDLVEVKADSRYFGKVEKVSKNKVKVRLFNTKNGEPMKTCTIYLECDLKHKDILGVTLSPNSELKTGIIVDVSSSDGLDTYVLETGYSWMGRTNSFKEGDEVSISSHIMGTVRIEKI